MALDRLIARARAAIRHAPTAFRLGLPQIATVLAYRAAIRTGLMPRIAPSAPARGERLFRLAAPPRPAPSGLLAADSVLAEAEEAHAGRLRLFSDTLADVGDPPLWHRDPLTGTDWGRATRHWSVIEEFGRAGDIKSVWEASRFDWALMLAQAWRITGDERHAALLRRWSLDWRRANPPGMGVNWKCGQETSYRLLQVLLVVRLLGEDGTPEPGLVSFVAEHCRRVRPTILYAMAQDNNHGTSEAAALYVGGAWLLRHAGADRGLEREAGGWRRTGRKWLADRARRLVAEDGSFAEHSPTYHRIVLDTFSMVEFWRRALGEEELPPIVTQRASAMIDWLASMTDEATGAAPIIGGNDGTNLLKLAGPRYGDFRPCLQLASLLFTGKRRFGAGPWDDAAKWLELPLPDQAAPAQITPASRLMADGGWAVLSDGEAGSMRAVVRLPVYRQRPAHADALHLDLWLGGVNVLPDAGSFSYNAPEDDYRYFTGTAAHNTVEIDGRDQMPRLGRFLFGDWLKADPAPRLAVGADGAMTLTAGYRDGEGARHVRQVVAGRNGIKVLDRIEGARQGACLRWRLAPEIVWAAQPDGVRSETLSIAVEVIGAHRTQLWIVDGAISTRYMRREVLPVLEVRAEGEGAIAFRTRLVPNGGKTR
jgi:hypothetical protein